MMSDALAVVLSKIDELNSADPIKERVNGVEKPRELAYSQRLTDWVLRLDPEASLALRIAARGQHVQRWKIPRESYPMTRAGYLKWREALKTFHADTVAVIMAAAGFAPEMIQRVRRLISKKDLKTDADTQTLEDALCLLFLETQLDDLRAKTPDEKMLDVARKTWGKMSERAKALAVKLPLSEDNKAFLRRALGL